MGGVSLLKWRDHCQERQEAGKCKAFFGEELVVKLEGMCRQ